MSFGSQLYAMCLNKTSVAPYISNRGISGSCTTNVFCGGIPVVPQILWRKPYTLFSPATNVSRLCLMLRRHDACALRPAHLTSSQRVLSNYGIFQICTSTSDRVTDLSRGIFAGTNRADWTPASKGSSSRLSLKNKRLYGSLARQVRCLCAPRQARKNTKPGEKIWQRREGKLQLQVC